MSPIVKNLNTINYLESLLLLENLIYSTEEKRRIVLTPVIAEYMPSPDITVFIITYIVDMSLI